MRCTIGDCECHVHTFGPVPPSLIAALTATMQTDQRKADEWETISEALRESDN